MPQLHMLCHSKAVYIDGSTWKQTIVLACVYFHLNHNWNHYSYAVKFSNRFWRWKGCRQHAGLTPQADIDRRTISWSQLTVSCQHWIIILGSMALQSAGAAALTIKQWSLCRVPSQTLAYFRCMFTLHQVMWVYLTVQLDATSTSCIHIHNVSNCW